jgi:predicted transcriptional regulator
MGPKNKQSGESPKTLIIKVPAELKRKLERQKQQTGETLSKMVERAIANLLDSRQESSRFHAEQETLAQQLHAIANDLRKIVYKIDKMAPEHAPDAAQALNMVVIGKKPAWHNHPQKEKIFQMVRDLHRVGANLTMIASALRLEGLQNINGDGEWKPADVEKIVAEIKKESDYFPPLYSLPE